MGKKGKGKREGEKEVAADADWVQYSTVRRMEKGTGEKERESGGMAKGEGKGREGKGNREMNQ